MTWCIDFLEAPLDDLGPLADELGPGLLLAPCVKCDAPRGAPCAPDCIVQQIAAEMLRGQTVRADVAPPSVAGAP